MTAPVSTTVDVSLVTKLANSAKALITLLTSALLTASLLLPDGRLKGYLMAAVAVAGTVAAWRVRNAATVNLLIADLESFAPMLTRWFGVPVTVTVAAPQVAAGDVPLVAGSSAAAPADAAGSGKHEA